MTIYYIITKYLTFPGAFLRTFWEQFMCKAMKLPIENNKCLQTNEMCGHIEHEMVNEKAKSFWFAFIPGLLVFIAGMIFFVPSLINIYFLGVSNPVLKIAMYVLLYFAASCLTNIFPGIEDAMVMWENYKGLKTGLKILFAPGAVIMYAGAYLEKFGITFITNALIAAAIIIL